MAAHFADGFAVGCQEIARSEANQAAQFGAILGSSQ
jgi:hypothetical protein